MYSKANQDIKFCRRERKSLLARQQGGDELNNNDIKKDKLHTKEEAY
jgi:hypothetical protein